MDHNSSNVVILDRGLYITCAVNLHGCTITSWRHDNIEQLFVSKSAIFDEKRAIRGGIPFVFPIYGHWDFGPDHSFARISTWKIKKPPTRLRTGDIEAIFTLEDNDFTRAHWNFQFRIYYYILLKEKELHLNVRVENTSDLLPFRFNLVFYNHLKTLGHPEIIGLQDCTAINKNRDCYFEDEKEKIIIDGGINRVYLNTPDELLVRLSGREMQMYKWGFPDVVVWNPGLLGAIGIGDMRDEEHSKFVCVEFGSIQNLIVLNPGEFYEAGQILQVLL